MPNRAGFPRIVLIRDCSPSVLRSLLTSVIRDMVFSCWTILGSNKLRQIVQIVPAHGELILSSLLCGHRRADLRGLQNSECRPRDATIFGPQIAITRSAVIFALVERL